MNEECVKVALYYSYTSSFAISEFVSSYLDEKDVTPLLNDQCDDLQKFLKAKSSKLNGEAHSSVLEKMMEMEAFREKVIVGSCNVSDKQLRERVNILSSLDFHRFELTGVMERFESLQEAFYSSSSNLCQKLGSSFASHEKVTDFIKSEESIKENLIETFAVIRDLESLSRNIIQWHLSRQPSTTESETLEKIFRKVMSDYRRSLNKLHKLTPLSGSEERLIAETSPDKLSLKDWHVPGLAKIESQIQEAREKARHCDDASITRLAGTFKKVMKELKEKYLSFYKLMSDIKDLMRTIMKFKNKSGLAVQEYVKKYRSYVDLIAAIFDQMQMETFDDGCIDALSSSLIECLSQTRGIYEELLQLCGDYDETKEKELEDMEEEEVGQSADSNAVSTLPSDASVEDTANAPATDMSQTELPKSLPNNLNIVSYKGEPQKNFFFCVPQNFLCTSKNLFLILSVM